VEVTAFALDHQAPCYGFAFLLKRPGKFDPVRARALGVPTVCWRALQSGESVMVDGECITPDQVLGPARKGIKLAYCTDTRVTDAIVTHAKNADLLICEGTYGEDAKAEKADLHGHMTFSQAAGRANRAGARELLLTHFSPATGDPLDHIDLARDVFPNTGVAQDLLCRTMLFENG